MESSMYNEFLLHAPPNTRLFRNNVGLGWVGKPEFREGILILRQFRPLHAGLCVGSADLVGWTVVNGVAVFTGIEMKIPGKQATKEQRAFLDTLNRMGGIGILATSASDAIKQVNERVASYAAE